jgi:4'-phosphopantetheinyl transferase
MSDLPVGSTFCPPIGEVQIWFARIDVDPRLVGTLEATLSQRERDRANRFVFERHKARYIFAQGVLRDVLSRATGVPPSGIAFTVNRYGKPFLAAELWPSELQFNLSHSQDMVAVGLTVGRAIGVDVEFIRPLVDLNGVAMDNYTPGEFDSILRLRPEDREPLFFRYWTRKESYIKAIGKGLSIPLNTFDTRFPPGEKACTLGRTVDAPGIESWRIEDLIPPPGYRAAVTVEQGIDRIEYREWLPQ